MPYPTNDMTEMMGIGNYVGEVRRGPDGQLYQWVHGVDGLGNPVGFWKKLKSVVGKVTSAIPGVSHVKKIAKGFCSVLPKIQPIVSLHPAIGPVARIGTKVCGTLKRVGLLGVDGEIMQAPDGQHYEVIEGIGEFGESQMMMRPVRLIIPAYINRGGHMPTAAMPMMPGTKGVRKQMQSARMQRMKRVRRSR
ncbi:MAG: hypothetical protein ACU84H_17080 [Gammaproteobacteria bacterium]